MNKSIFKQVSDSLNEEGMKESVDDEEGEDDEEDNKSRNELVDTTAYDGHWNREHNAKEEKYHQVAAQVPGEVGTQGTQITPTARCDRPARDAASRPKEGKC